MKRLFTITDTSNPKTKLNVFFENKMEAKRARDALNDDTPPENTKPRFVVSKGPDHQHAR